MTTQNQFAVVETFDEQVSVLFVGDHTAAFAFANQHADQRFGQGYHAQEPLPGPHPLHVVLKPVCGDVLPYELIIARVGAEVAEAEAR